MTEEKSEVDLFFDKWERRFTFLNRVGWPTFLLFIFGLLFWKFCVWIGPICEKVANEHCNFVQKTSETQQIQANNGREMVEVSRQQQELLESVSKRLDELHRIMTRGPKEFSVNRLD